MRFRAGDKVKHVPSGERRTETADAGKRGAYIWSGGALSVLRSPSAVGSECNCDDLMSTREEISRLADGLRIVSDRLADERARLVHVIEKYERSGKKVGSL